MRRVAALLLLLCPVWAVVSDRNRVDCFPEPGATLAACQARGCTWKPASDPTDPAEPWCFMPQGTGYKYYSGDASNMKLVKNDGIKCPYGADIDLISFTTKNIGSALNVKIGVEGRYEVPVPFPRSSIPSSDALAVDVNTKSDPFSFRVYRKSTYRTIFDTSIGGMMFSDKFIQIATYLPSSNMYGWGENSHRNIKHDFTKYTTWGMFARDEPPNNAGLDTKNLYGVHPYYIMIEPDGKAHGVLFLNSNAQDVTTIPAPGFVYRTIGGNLDMYFFPGPTPEAVTQQYLTFIGTPFLPAYWSLGFQLCRYGYKGLAEMQKVISNVRGYGIPIDVTIADIDYMNRYKDFTVGNEAGNDWTGLADYAKQLHDEFGMKLILIWDPAIEVDYDTFQRALGANARFIEWERKDQVMTNIQDQYPMAKDTKIMLGVVWPDKHVAFPDFLDETNNTQTWWIDEFKRFQTQVAYDGVWIDMNEPSNFGTNEDHPWYYDSDDHPNDLPLKCPQEGSDALWDMPPYHTHNVYNYGAAGGANTLSTKTLCMLATQTNGKHRFYNTKSLYGLTESIHTLEALHAATGKRGAVISRSTFPSSGRYAGHWLGDNSARWDDLQNSVIGAQEFNMFGIPYVGSDICGFIGTTTEELCLRWQQMGSFHSFSRNHNTLGDPAQDPAVWPSVAAATRKANLYRYKHLPYLFSLHFLSSMTGSTVIRPVFFEFPHDQATYDLGYQFMWGPAIMVAPVVYEGVDSVNVYIPDGVWYSLYDGYHYGERVTVGYADFPAPTTADTPTFARGGYIVPRQQPNVTTTWSRKNPFELMVASGADGSASGELFWDDGEKIVTSFGSHNYYQWKFTFNTTSAGAKLNITQFVTGSNIPLPTMDVIEILGYPAYPDFSSFYLNDKKINIDSHASSYNAVKKVLTISTASLLDISQSSLELRWTHSNGVVAVDGLNDPTTVYHTELAL